MPEMLLDEILSACAGMTEDEIFIALEESGLFAQPELVAGFLAYRAAPAA